MDLETTHIGLDALEIRSDNDAHYLEGICVPWGTRTDRVPVPEIFVRGAFADLIDSKARIKLIDYNHDLKRIPVAYSTAVEDRSNGLWARFRFNNTFEGRNALENVSAGVYDGLSVGFYAQQHHMTDGVRHVDKARLHHVSLVEEPAYDDARILAVRAADLDSQIQAWRELAERRWDLDTRDQTSQNLLMTRISRRANTR